MSSWDDVGALAPDLAAEVERIFGARVHKTMATLRADGSPRLSGTELIVRAGELWLGSMKGARKGADLRRDPRVAVHSGSDDPPLWRGDAKVDALAVEVTDEMLWRQVLPGPEHTPATADLFRLELTRVTVVALDEDGQHLVVTTWREGHGVSRTLRR